MRVYLDDERPIPDDYDVLVQNAQHAITILKTGAVTAISLDHDLGLDQGNGMQVAEFIEYAAAFGAIKRLKWVVHTGNAAAAPGMKAALTNANKYWAAQEKKRG